MTEGGDQNDGAMSKKALKKLEKQRQKEDAKKAKAVELAAAVDEDTAVGLYGKAEMNQSQTLPSTRFVEFGELCDFEGQTVTVLARVLNVRPQGSKMVFLTLRQKSFTAQALLVKAGNVSKQMLKFCAGVSSESIVKIEAIVTRSPEEIKSCSVKEFELKVQKIFVESESARLPFGIEEASRSAAEIEANEGYNPIHLDTRYFCAD
jgi:aspartyl-tRNA synthetase